MSVTMEKNLIVIFKGDIDQIKQNKIYLWKCTISALTL